jgi:putative membrane protein
MGTGRLLPSRISQPLRPSKETPLMNIPLLILALAFGIASVASVQAQTPVAANPAPAINDAQIAHIAHTAGQIDITAARQALQKSRNKDVRAFAEEMARDHAAVNDQALALVKKLGVTPENNPTSESLSKSAAAELKTLAALKGSAFDKAYVDNEVAYHQAVNGALSGTLIPSAQNAELKSLLETGLKLFQSHQAHAEHLAQSLK